MPALERQLGATIFKRTSTGAVLTEIGSSLVEPRSCGHGELRRRAPDRLGHRVVGGSTTARQSLPSTLARHFGVAIISEFIRACRTFVDCAGQRVAVPGDRARWLPDGTIQLLGRDAATINSGGEKIYAEEIEEALRSHPSVADAVVVGRPHERWGSEIVAVVQETRPVSDETLRNDLARRLARYKLPKAFIRVGQVPRSPAGKPDYRWARGIVGGEPSEAASSR